MLHIVLVEPEIPANTGNIARTCAATGAHLHLIRPLGFDISDAAVRRAGLDYWHLVDVTVHDSLQDLFAQEKPQSFWLFTTKAPRIYTEVTYSEDAWLFFGKETKGLPEDFLRKNASHCLRIPMRAEARSLNLGNSVALVTYEALRQQNFPYLIGQGRMIEWDTEERKENDEL